MIEERFDCEACDASASVPVTTGTCDECGAGPMDSICCDGAYNCANCPKERRS
jgi:hypothetical protein